LHGYDSLLRSNLNSIFDIEAQHLIVEEVDHLQRSGEGDEEGVDAVDQAEVIGHCELTLIQYSLLSVGKLNPR
jgi:hypothetical protein